MNVENRTLFVADNLPVLRGIDTAIVDLIATDPPFNSKRMFDAPVGSRAAGAGFSDKWRWDDVADEWCDLLTTPSRGVKEVIEAAAIIEGGRINGGIDTGRVTNSMAAYLCWIAPRLIEMQRVLKPSGSLWLHCDDAADSYLRLLLDAIFGRGAFRNAVTWKRQSSNNSSNGRCGRISDTLLFYAGKGATWNGGHHELSAAELREYRTDSGGRRYKCNDLTAPDTTGVAERHFTWRGATPPSSRRWIHSAETMERMLAKGEIELRENGEAKMRGRVKLLDDNRGQRLQSIWTDIQRVGNTARERTGYPGQKPVALYERIITASSNANDVVLDPFCGCSTTLLAAERLGRRWIGCDKSERAADVIRTQINNLIGPDALPLFSETFTIRRNPPQRTDIS